MPDISKIKIENNVYNIKDENARNEINLLNLPKNYFTNRKIILIGDSYAEGYTPGGNIFSWQSYFINLTGLSNTICKFYGGVGFVNILDNKTFQTLLEEVEDDIDVTDVVVLGGYNDQNYNDTQIKNAMKSFQLKANEKFPNANLHVGMVGWSKDSSKLYPLNQVMASYKRNAPACNMHYINNIHYSLHDYFSDFSNDGIHPNSNGQYNIAINLIQGLLSGSSEVQFDYSSIVITPHSNITLEDFDAIGCTLNNNIVEITNQKYPFIRMVQDVTASQSSNRIEIGSISSGYIIGSSFPMCQIPVRLIIGCDEGFINALGFLIIQNGKLYVEFGQANATGNNYQTFTNISQIQVSAFHALFNSEFC